MRGTTRRRIGRKLGSLFLCFAMLLSLVVLPVQAVTVDGTYTPGTYTGTAEGYAGEVSVTVTLAAGEDGGIAISDIQATGTKETPNRWEDATTILGTIQSQNGTDGLMDKLTGKEIDTVSGATISAKAIVTATDKALAQALRAAPARRTIRTRSPAKRACAISRRRWRLAPTMRASTSS